MSIHRLKTWPEHYRAVRDTRKTYELRRDDRDFDDGDILELAEWVPETREFTGRSLLVEITHMLRDFDGLAPGYVLLSVELI